MCCVSTVLSLSLLDSVRQNSGAVEMVCNFLLSWTLLLLSIGPLLAHPVSETAEMSYPGPGECNLYKYDPVYTEMGNVALFYCIEFETLQ